MNTLLEETLWKQFGASIDMLENAIQVCPATIWNTETRFWYIGFHCLFFLDYYLTLQPKNFVPPPPFTFSEFEDTMPERVYSKNELLTYLQTNRNKLHNLMANMTDDIANSEWVNVSGSMRYPVIELLLYNMRHVQHHSAQLNLLLRQGINDAPDWVSRTKVNL